MKIQSKVPTDEYKENWDVIFSTRKKPEGKKFSSEELEKAFKDKQLRLPFENDCFS